MICGYCMEKTDVGQSWDLKSYNMLLGENVKEFFRRVAAITFEQAILRELESQDARTGKLQIGSGGVLSK